MHDQNKINTNQQSKITQIQNETIGPLEAWYVFINLTKSILE